MTAANNITDILHPYLKKIESAYNRVHYSDDVDCQKNCYAIGKGGLIISVKKVDASLTIQVIEEMSLKNIEDYLLIVVCLELGRGLLIRRQKKCKRF